MIINASSFPRALVDDLLHILFHVEQAVGLRNTSVFPMDLLERGRLFLLFFLPLPILLLPLVFPALLLLFSLFFLFQLKELPGDILLPLALLFLVQVMVGLFIILFLELAKLADHFLQQLGAVSLVFLELLHFLSHLVGFLSEVQCGQTAYQIMAVFMAQESLAGMLLVDPAGLGDVAPRLDMESLPLDADDVIADIPVDFGQKPCALWSLPWEVVPGDGLDNEVSDLFGNLHLFGSDDHFILWSWSAMHLNMVILSNSDTIKINRS